MPPWNMQPELTLFARMRQGDEEAFVALYRRHQDAVYRFALLRTGSAAQAADVTQETFLHLMTRPEQYDPSRGSIAAWLCGVARNLARRETRLPRGRDRPRRPGDGATPPPDLVDAAAPPRSCSPRDRRAGPRRARRGRPALPRRAHPCELSELSYAEAAQVCGIDIGTVRSRLSRPAPSSPTVFRGWACCTAPAA